MNLYRTSLGVLLCCLSVSTSIKAETNLPIADIHMHAYQKTATEAEWFGSRFEMNGVKWAGGVGNYSEQMAKELGQRYIGAFGQDYLWVHLKSMGLKG